MRSFLVLGAALALFSACGGGPTQMPGDSGQPDSGSGGGSDGGGNSDGGLHPGGDGGTPVTGCGSGGGGPTGGPADLFPCDSPWYRDVSTASVAAESSAIVSAIVGKGGFGRAKGMTVTFDFYLLHDDGSAPKRAVMLAPHDTNDVNDYYADESDTLLPRPNTHGLPIPTPAGAAIEGQARGASALTCPTAHLDSQHPAYYSRVEDCHFLVVDDARHLLFELYSSTYDAAQSTWYTTGESVWNLGWHYGGDGRGLTCTSADAAGLSISPGLIGLRETLAASKVAGGTLKHALRFILPNDRIRSAFIAPGAHRTSSATLSNGPAYGIRMRLRSDFNESLVTTPGGKVLVRTLKRYGMFLADGGNDTLTAERQDLLNAQDSTLTWSGLLGGDDLNVLKLGDFEVVDYDSAQVKAPSSNCNVLEAPLDAFLH